MKPQLECAIMKRKKHQKILKRKRSHFNDLSVIEEPKLKIKTKILAPKSRKVKNSNRSQCIEDSNAQTVFNLVQSVIKEEIELEFDDFDIEPQRPDRPEVFPILKRVNKSSKKPVPRLIDKSCREIWSFQQLNKLIKNENSCIYRETMIKHLALRPIDINNIKKTVKNILNPSLNSYHPQCKGILLKFHSIRASRLELILQDKFYVDADIEVKVFIFRPQVRQMITGVVNKKTYDYLQVLVHDVFNVLVVKEEEKNWEGHNLEVADNVSLIIEKVNLEEKLPFITGRLCQINK